MPMLAIGFFVWWYTGGWARTVQDLRHRCTNTLNLFSLPSLLRTLFAPWRRIIASPQAGLGGRLSAMVDNLLSRCIGFVVRLFTLIAALVMLLFVAVINLILVVIWPLLPLASIALIIRSLV